FFQAEDGIRDFHVTGVQTCALPILPQGQRLAIVGPSGAGKSTLLQLIARFYDVDTGAVRMGGVDIRAIDTEYLMSQISFVFQHRSEERRVGKGWRPRRSTVNDNDSK